MANFHFYLGNHDSIGKRTLYDLIDYITLGLTYCNHTVTKSSVSLSGRSINLLFENFRVGHGEVLKESGVKFGIIATEYYDGRRLNFDGSMAWRLRMRGLEEVAPLAKFIWCMYKDCVVYYSNFAPTKHLRLGSTGRSDLLFGEKNIPISFLGKLTPYRDRYLGILRKKGVIVSSPQGFLSNAKYLGKVKKSRLVLCIRQTPTWPLPSYARVCRALNEGCGVLSDQFEVDDYLKKYLFLIPNSRADRVASMVKSITDNDLQSKLIRFNREMNYKKEWRSVLNFTAKAISFVNPGDLKRGSIPMRLDYFFEWFSLGLLEGRELRSLVLTRIDQIFKASRVDVIWGLGSVERRLGLVKRYHPDIKYLCDKDDTKLEFRDRYGLSVFQPKDIFCDQGLVTLVTFPRIYLSRHKRLPGTFIYIDDLVFDSLAQLKTRHAQNYFSWLSKVKSSSRGVRLKNLLS